MIIPQLTPASAFVLAVVALFSALCWRIIHNVYFHPLAKFPGPWYTSSFSLSGAIISVLKIEPEWLQGLVKKYGSE